MNRLRLTFGVTLYVVSAAAAHAHAGSLSSPGAWWRLWSWDPEVVTAVFLIGAVYASGLRALRRATRSPRKLQREARCYAGGWLLLAIALISPLHPWGSRLFSVHMTQHELLMVAAAPLIVLGRPATVMLFALPPGSARRGVAHLRKLGAGHVWGWLSHPFCAWLIHAIALWVWHVPVLFESTLESEWVHALQHASFFGTALLFWQSVFHGPQRRTGYGLAVLNLFTTAIHSGALGALLTFASRTWYPVYAARAEPWGLTALEDQQLGGLIMWIPTGLIYVIAGLALFAGWLREPGATKMPTPAPALPCASSSSF